MCNYTQFCAGAGLIPMAASIVFGLLMSTVLVLVVVPCLYTILADFNLVRVSDIN